MSRYSRYWHFEVRCWNEDHTSYIKAERTLSDDDFWNPVLRDIAETEARKALSRTPGYRRDPAAKDEPGWRDVRVHGGQDDEDDWYDDGWGAAS